MYRLWNLLSLPLWVGFGTPALASERIVLPSPDRALQTLEWTDRRTGESLLEIRGRHGNLLCRRDFRSPDGEHGEIIEQAAWTPDSRFFVFTVTSSGGHQPWKLPTFVYCRRTRRLLDLERDGGLVTVSDFHLRRDVLMTRLMWGQNSGPGVPATIPLPALVRNPKRRPVVTGYTLTVLKHAGWDSCNPSGINDWGQVVGSYDTPGLAKPLRAFLWENGKAVDLTQQGFPGLPIGINNAGTVLGSISAPNPGDNTWNLSSGFLWNLSPAHGQPHPVLLTGLQKTPLMPLGLDDAGRVLCVSGPARLGHPARPWVWEAGHVRRLKSASGPGTPIQFAFNQEGVIAATVGLGDGSDEGREFRTVRGRLWKSGRLLRALPAPRTCQALYLNGLNAQGQAVGSAWLNGLRDREGDALYTAVLWDGRRWIDLNRFLPPHSGCHLETASAISGTGEIVGAEFTGQETAEWAFLLVPAALAVR